MCADHSTATLKLLVSNIFHRNILFSTQVRLAQETARKQETFSKSNRVNHHGDNFPTKSEGFIRIILSQKC